MSNGKTELRLKRHPIPKPTQCLLTFCLSATSSCSSLYILLSSYGFSPLMTPDLILSTKSDLEIAHWFIPQTPTESLLSVRLALL